MAAFADLVEDKIALDPRVADLDRTRPLFACHGKLVGPKLRGRDRL